MAICCNTLEGNMQYGDDPYCFTPSTYVHLQKCFIQGVYSVKKYSSFELAS